MYNEYGITGERIIIIPQPFIDIMNDNPLTGDLYIHSLGYVSQIKHPKIVSSNTNEFIFLYCSYGKAYINVSGEQYILLDNEYIVIPSNTSFSYTTDKDNPWSFYWVRFSGEKAKIFAKKMSIPSKILPSIYSRIEQRTDLFEVMYNVLSGDINLDKLNYANICFYHFISSFLYADTFNITYNAPKHADSMINKVTHYMNENIEKKLSLQEIASYVGFSESYFYRQFVKRMDISPIDYFTKMKINKASIYLIKTSMSISQIASKFGFSSSEYFSRTFKKIIGISATEFRKQNFKL